MIEVQLKKFQKNWDQQLEKNYEKIHASRYELKKPNLLNKSILNTYKPYFIVAVFLSFFFSLLSYVNTMVFKEIMDRYENNYDIW